MNGLCRAAAGRFGHGVRLELVAVGDPLGS